VLRPIERLCPSCSGVGRVVTLNMEGTTENRCERCDGTGRIKEPLMRHPQLRPLRHQPY
jgi:DnaJ-class molecular chaperone